MAKIDIKSLLYGVSGKMGNFVFKNIRGKTYICLTGEKPVKPPTEAQLRMRRRFAEAVAWGQKLKKDMSLKRYYETHLNGSPSAYNAAIRDYQRAPEIQEVHCAMENDLLHLTIYVKDDTAVTACWCEYGEERIECTDNGKGDVYRVMLAADTKEVCIKARDLPGNLAEEHVDVDEYFTSRMAG
ncbi:MAG: hypothetical protein WBB45_08550 [Cyclobacteriaceae bacterium]